MPTARIFDKNPDDVVICAAYRTPITKGYKGGLKDLESYEILTFFLQEFLKKVDIDPALIEDICIGNVCEQRDKFYFRAAQFTAGIPYTTNLWTVNRQCGSGLQAVTSIAHEIKSGEISVGLALGCESMTKEYDPVKMFSAFPARFLDKEQVQPLLQPMGLMSERVSKEFGLSRQDLDEFAAESFQKAEKAQKAGLFSEEILPISFGGRTVSEDDGIRYGMTAEKLGELKPAFDASGSTTAANSSQISDGAGGVLMARRDVAEKLGLPIIGKFAHTKCATAPVEILGVTPVYAIPSVLEDLGLTVDDVDLFEINEAFASQSVYVVRELGLDPAKVNPKGGAIALGHPLGATGARQVSTLLTELQRTGKNVGVISMCLAGGMGLASVIVRE